MKESKKQSNREHHFSFYEEDYSQVAKEIALDLFRLAELHRRAFIRNDKMVAMDANRRANAIAMGVKIKESDEKYSFEKEIALMPEIIKHMKRYEDKYKVKLGDIRELDKGRIL